MNKLVKAIKSLDAEAVQAILTKEPQWLAWAEEGGKNALHYIAGVPTGGDALKEAMALKIAQLLLDKGMDINAEHRIKDECGYFPARPLWYAYTRGRNVQLYTSLLSQGANPENCMFAIAWYDDVPAAELFRRHGATVDDLSIITTPFLSAFLWRKFAMAEWFLKQGANINAPDPKGNTALCYAVKRKYPAEQIMLLLNHGADINQENEEGISPKKLVEHNRQRKILELFDTFGHQQ